MVQLPFAEQFQALQQALAEAARRSDEAAARNVALIGEMRVLRTERDLLKGKRSIDHVFRGRG